MMSLAMPASRSLIALLVGTVAFFALWIVALKPGGSSNSTSTQSQGLYQSAINKAHQAVQTSNGSNAASGNVTSGGASAAGTATNGTATASHGTTAAKSATQSRRATASKPAASHRTAPGTGRRSAAAVNRFSTVQQAVRKHKVVAILFYNPAGPDDQAVKRELASISTNHGQVVKLTIPLGEASNYTAVTQQVPLNFSPTLVLIARNGDAGEIVGFSDRFEIAQRVIDALATK
jgi:hypothetical protein